MKTASSSHDHTLALSNSLDGFFEELLVEALREHRTEASDAASSYLVTLLRDYAHPGREAAAPLNGSLTLLLAEALDTPGGERFERLKSLGDGVLYVRGFFLTISRRAVSPSTTSIQWGRGRTTAPRTCSVRARCPARW